MPVGATTSSERPVRERSFTRHQSRSCKTPGPIRNATRVRANATLPGLRVTVPAVKIGYGRVSTRGQEPELDHHLVAGDSFGTPGPCLTRSSASKQRGACVP